jgi:DNA repair protein RadC
VVLLNARGEELRTQRVAGGGLTCCSVLPREALSPAVLHAAPLCAFVHNHPSGTPVPSADDLRLQARLDAAAAALGVGVVDHLIVAEHGVHSAREGALGPPGELQEESDT